MKRKLLKTMTGFMGGMLLLSVTNFSAYAAEWWSPGVWIDEFGQEHIMDLPEGAVEYDEDSFVKGVDWLPIPSDLKTVEEIEAACPEGYHVEGVIWKDGITGEVGVTYGYYAKNSEEQNVYIDGDNLIAEIASAEIIRGDVDGDNKITVQDAQLILNKALGVVQTNIYSVSEISYDVNNDDAVDLEDVQNVLEKALGIN